MLAAAALPNADWQSSGLEFAGTTEDGFARLTETPNFRVQRSFIRGKAAAGEALTFSIGVAPQGRRFVSLWLSDTKSTIFHVEAIFDIIAGTPVSISTLFDRSQVFAALAPIAEREDGSKAYRVWVSITALQKSEVLQAQISTRETSSGPRRLVGNPEKGFLARRFLLESNATPSLFPEPQKQAGQAQSGGRSVKKAPTG